MTLKPLSQVGLIAGKKSKKKRTKKLIKSVNEGSLPFGIDDSCISESGKQSGLNESFNDKNKTKIISEDEIISEGEIMSEDEVVSDHYEDSDVEIDSPTLKEISKGNVSFVHEENTNVGLISS